MSESAFPSWGKWRGAHTGSIALADRFTWLIIAGLVLLAAALRLHGVGLASISHPEAYVPGLDLVPGLSEPPPRLDFAFTLLWHFHEEPHPMGWYLAMFGWTTLFGTSEAAIRMPSVLFGAGSVALVYALGRRAFGPAVGLLAAVLLTLHGFHVFWSQIARMYAAGVFLGLASTVMLLSLASAKRVRPGLEVAYVMTCVAGALTLEMFWPVLMMQVAWISLTVARPGAPVFRGLARPHVQGPRLLQVQAAALMLSAPELLRSVYLARHGAADPSSFEFLRDFLSYGFLMIRNWEPIPLLDIPPLAHGALLLSALVLLVAALRARPAADARPTFDGMPPLRAWLLPALAVVATLFMLWLASIAHRRNVPLTAMATLPVMALFAPWLGAALRTLVEGISPLRQALQRVSPGALLVWFVGVVAPLLLMVAGMAVEITVPRSFLIFVPGLLIVLSAGALSISSRPAAQVAIVAALLGLFLYSLVYNARNVVSPNDYKELAQEMKPLLRSDDLVFVRDRQWVDTPFFYYLPDAHYVAGDYAAALASNPAARVWLITWPTKEEPVIADARREALERYRRVEELTALRASAELFVPPGR